MDVTVVHLMPTLMERQLDPAAGHLLQRAIEARGIEVLTGANTEAILGDEPRRRRASSTDGTRAAGRPGGDGGRHPAQHRSSPRRPGSTVNRGIVVDDHMRTSDPDIFAVGECAEHRGQVLRPGGAALRDGRTLRRAARRRRRGELSRLGARRPSSRSPASICSRPATSPRRRTARRSCCATPRAASTSAAGAEGQPGRRRGAVRRYGGRRLVSSTC